jgi:hypothetical protein
VTWTDPTPASSAKGNTQNEIGFRVERAQIVNGLPGSFALLSAAAPVVDGRVNTLANATNFQDAPAPFTDYNYRVVSVNEGGSGTSATFLLSQAPALPTGLTASTVALANRWKVNLNWTDVATNASNYVVQQATGSISAATGVVTWSAFVNQPRANSLLPSKLATFTDVVSANNLYQYQVYAVNGALVGAAATVVTATATTLPGPTQMQSGGASTMFSVSLQWQPVLSALGTGYEIQHCTGSALQCTSGPLALWTLAPAHIKDGLANTSKVINTGLARLTTYQFRVRAFNALVPSLVSPWSTMFEASTM